MAIFNNSNRKSDSNSENSNTTIITTGAKITGELNFSCNLFIDGELRGNINSSKEVNIGKNGYVLGEIKTNKLVVLGSVEGSIEANIVEIKEGARVKGEISSNELIIEAKGVFEGTSVVKDTQAFLEKVKEV